MTDTTPKEETPRCERCGTEMEWQPASFYEDQGQQLCDEAGDYYFCPLPESTCQSIAALHSEVEALRKRNEELERQLEEAKANALIEEDQLLAVLPEDFGAVEYIKHLTSTNAALEEKLAEVQRLHRRDYNRNWARKREDELTSLKTQLQEANVERNIMRREGYQAAMILAHNLCAQVSDEHNADDEISERNGASNCVSRIKGWLNPSDNEIMQLVAESEPARDQLASEASRKKGAEHGA